MCFLIAFAYAAPTPNDEAIVADVLSADEIQPEALQEIILLLKKKLLLG